MLTRALLFTLLLFTYCTINTITKNKVKTMKSAFTLKYNKTPDLWPEMVGLKDDVTQIFSIPSENSVGTNEIGPAIIGLEFNGNGIAYHELIKNHPGASAGGLYSFCPVFDKEWIAYGQTRGFNLFNVKKHTFLDFSPYQSLWTRITQFASIPNSPFTFLIQTERANQPESDRVFQIIQFDTTGTFMIKAQLEQFNRHYGEKGEPWSFSGDTLVTYNRNDTILEAFNDQLKPVPHPLCTLFNQRKDHKIPITKINFFITHPTLPFAILKEYIDGQGSIVWLVRWDVTDKNESFIHLLSRQLSVFSGIKELIVSHFEFSPDGRWLVFRDWSEDYNNPMFMAMPVDSTYEHFLGKPKLLGKVMRENARPTSAAWIQKPLSYVVSDGMVLYKWELDKLSREQ